MDNGEYYIAALVASLIVFFALQKFPQLKRWAGLFVLALAAAGAKYAGVDLPGLPDFDLNEIGDYGQEVFGDSPGGIAAFAMIAYQLFGKNVLGRLKK